MPSDDTIHNLLDFLFGKKQLQKAAGTAPAVAPPAAPSTAQTDLAKAIAANPNNQPKSDTTAMKILGAPRKKKPVMPLTPED